MYHSIFNMEYKLSSPTRYFILTGSLTYLLKISTRHNSFSQFEYPFNWLIHLFIQNFNLTHNLLF